VSWRADFISDSCSALALLHEVVRRLPVPSSGTSPKTREGVVTSNGNEDDISSYIAESLTPMFEARRCAGITTSTFELYPEALQRVTLGIFVLLGRLPVPALTALGATCSRSHRLHLQHAIPVRMATAVMEAVHSIRRRLSMREYFGFVLEASGVLNLEDEGPEPAAGECISGGDGRPELPVLRAMALDRALQVACRLLVECGPASKVLSMLWPMLLSYLTASDDRSVREELLKGRTAVTIVAFLLQFSDGAFILNDDRDTAAALARCVARLCCAAYAVVEEEDPRVTSFVRPAVSLISIRQTNILPTVFRLALSSNEIGAASNPTSRPNSVLRSLHHLVRSAELRDVVDNCAGELTEIVRSCDLSAPVDDTVNRSSGPDQIWFGRLLAELEAAQSTGEAHCHN
jgi:hypothetical protein